MRRLYRNHTEAFKAKVVIAALKGEETWVSLAERFADPPNSITPWKTQFLGCTIELLFRCSAVKSSQRYIQNVGLGR